MTTVDQEKIAAFADVARGYCQIIDNMDGTDCELRLQQVGQLLPLMHNAVMAMGASEPQKLPEHEHAEFDERFTLFSRILECLGDRSAYPVDLDESDDDQVESGSLADDFTDIYFDLKNGLELYDQGQSGFKAAQRKWLDTFQLHWGQHLFDAIFALRARAAS